MKRFIIALVALSLTLPHGGIAQDSDEAKSGGELCQDYCAEKAAKRCDDIHSFRCGAYILGCLAGCNLTRL